jgi:hypothetical protein
MDWVGQGPERVWKNRLRGPQFGLWQKDYNDGVTGEDWSYPEFKGYYAGLHWLRVRDVQAPFTVVNLGGPLFLQMLRPKNPAHDPRGFVSPKFPGAGLGFLHAIPAMGTKFQPAEAMGPSGAKNSMRNYSWYEGSLCFGF